MGEVSAAVQSSWGGASSAPTIEIGGMPILVRTGSSEFRRMLEERYGGFVTDSRSGPPPLFEVEVELVPPGIMSDAEDVRVRLESRCWVMERGDFRAEWDPERRQARVRQSANPYAIDSVLRILHSLILARAGGFLVHAASAVRHGRAFLFAGVSGAGKTTIARLAPPDVSLLTDEVSYVRRCETAYEAFGTPFAGELARLGENLRAPLAALYLLAQGPENKIEPLPAADAVRALLANILFFAQDAGLVRRVFESAFDFVSRVPAARLTFQPDARVWELIA
jgi:hypothetical protein